MPEALTLNEEPDPKASNDPKVVKPRLPATLPPPEDIPLVGRWSSSYYSYAILGVLTIACLLPFSGRAFHVDDTLFVMAARQISRHPLDPYGFSLVWDTNSERMADVTKNPPLASYYGAAVGQVAGWSERAFHFAFLVPALALVLGTYRLAKHFTRFPLLAALATLLTPGILVSACSVMCDTTMLALWVWAVILWIEGLQPPKAWYLAGAGFLIAASALTKYFGASLILLLAAYSFARLRRLGNWVWYLLIPVGALIGYEFSTKALYGRGLLSDAAGFATAQQAFGQASRISMALIGLSFTGGCTLSVLAFSALIKWSRRAMAIVVAGSVLSASALIFGWVDPGLRVGGELAINALRAHWGLIGSQLGLLIAGGLFTLALAITDYWNRRSPDSLLLGLWVLGTFVFASFLNYTVNARSVLPLIPAAGILTLRRLETMHHAWTRSLILQVAGALIASGVLSIWVAGADARLANLARDAAHSVRGRTSNERGQLWFEGHWGFQYYMEQLGALPVDTHDLQIRPGDLVVVPKNNIIAGLPQGIPFEQEAVLEFANPSLATTISWQLGAGFYSSYWGPLPFTFGPVPPEQYVLVRAVPFR